MPEKARAGVCVSYPKSGRTWLRTMLADVGVDVEFTHLDSGHNYSAWGKAPEKLRKPRIEADKIIFLYRDPRDTVVSFFYETTIRQKPDAWRAFKFWIGGRSAPREMNRFVRSRRFGLEKVIAFNLLCAEHLKALPVSYEDLSADTEQSLSRMLRFLECPVDGERLAAVVENNRFEKMHAREAGGGYAKRGLQPRDAADPNSFKVRKGKVGGWQDELDAGTQAFASETLQRYDYFARLDGLFAAHRS